MQEGIDGVSEDAATGADGESAEGDFSFAFEFVAHLDDESFRAFLADAGEFAEEAGVVRGDGALKGADFHVANDPGGCFGADAGDGEEDLKEIALFFEKKSVEMMRIFSNDVGEGERDG